MLSSARRGVHTLPPRLLHCAIVCYLLQMSVNSPAGRAQSQGDWALCTLYRSHRPPLSLVVVMYCTRTRSLSTSSLSPAAAIELPILGWTGFLPATTAAAGLILMI
jgi:hypothetical protein